MARGDNLSIIYPSGCRQVTEDLGPDELVRRLKTLAHTLQSMGQDEGVYQEYIPLAMHLGDDFFLLHENHDVQLLIACCIADILRVYAPDAPYKDPAQIKTIFMFLISQLAGLKDPTVPAFKRYFYLLENLAYVKSFNMCFELEQCQEIFCKLFKLFFSIVNDEHSGKVKSFMLDVLCPLINESDMVSNELLDIILSNVLEPAKSQRKNAYNLAKDLIVKCADTLEPYIQAFFNHVLVLGKEEKKLAISQKVYGLIYELNRISPSVLLAVFPQLEFKLKSTDEEERFSAVSLLARMFSEKDSNLAVNHKQLWIAFLGRFNDISVKIRTKCVQHSMHFLLNHPELRDDITRTLKLRQHDSDENVRYEVVMSIVTTAKNDLSIVADSDDLLNFVKERTLDKKFKIRKEAMYGLGSIYKRHLNSSDVPSATKRAVTWIKDKILHGYYMTNIDDRLLVEKLLNTCLVPYQLPAEDRMKKLFQLFATIDENAGKAFIELQKHQLVVRKWLSEFMDIHRKPESEERDREIFASICQISKYLPDPLKVQEYLRKFSQHAFSDPQIRTAMDIILSPDTSCRESLEYVTQTLKKLGQPIMTNLYYNTIKMLLERVSNVLIDHEAVHVLIEHVKGALEDDPIVLDQLQLPSDIAVEKGLRLLYVLSFVYPSHFMHEDVLEQLISMLNCGSSSISSPAILSVLANVGKYKPIGDCLPAIASKLEPLCKELAVTGAPKEAKQAVRCIHLNLPSRSHEIFTGIVEKARENLTFDSEHFRTAVVTLGHISLSLPDKFTVAIKNLVSRKIVKELLMRNQTSEHTPGFQGDQDEPWLEEDEIGAETRVKMEGMKMMARWLIGLRDDVISAQKTFRMLNAFQLHRGDLLETGKMLQAEMAYLRLTAGTTMLKICEQKGVGDQFTAEQFYNLALLMVDKCPNVRERFALKLHKGLSRGVPHKCLPLDFMGFYGLAGLEPDKARRGLFKSYMMADINKRRDYIRSMTGTGEKSESQLPFIMPDYMLVFAIPLLAHLPEFSNPGDLDQLVRIKSCLWFVLEPLITKNDAFCFGFYKTLIEEMKNHRDAAKPQDELANTKLWAVCDLAMGLLLSKSTNFEMKSFPSEPRIPPIYFKKHEDPTFVNVTSYLPPELQVNAPKGSTKTLSGVSKKNSTLNYSKKDSTVQDKDDTNSSSNGHGSEPSKRRSLDSGDEGSSPNPIPNPAPSAKRPRMGQNNNKIVR